MFHQVCKPRFAVVKTTAGKQTIPAPKARHRVSQKLVRDVFRKSRILNTKRRMGTGKVKTSLPFNKKYTQEGLYMPDVENRLRLYKFLIFG